MTNDKVYETIKQIELTKKAFIMLDDLNRVAHNSLVLYETIKQIELTKKAFIMLEDLNRVAHNSLVLTEELVNKLSYGECIDVLAQCENIPISTKRCLADKAKKQNEKE